MTPEQKAAFINAQTMCAQAELCAMLLDNDAAHAEGEPRPHKPGDFRALVDRYGIHHNAVLTFFGGD